MVAANNGRKTISPTLIKDQDKIVISRLSNLPTFQHFTFPLP
jgi:hypothetical protein